MLSLNTLRASGMTALLLAASGTVATAADMLSAPPPPPVPVAAPVVGGDSGFYLRGDIGYGHNTYGKLDTHPYAAATSVVRSHNELRGSVIAGVGVGYQVNSWLRGDVTAEYRSAASYRFRERTTFASPLPPSPFTLNEATGNVDSVVGLVNAYVDLGTWNRITPFVGVGVGVRSSTFRDVHDQAIWSTEPGIQGNGSYGDAKKNTKTGLAWALHAGAAYDVSSNLKFEAGYRYLNMGTIKSANLSCTSGGGVFTADCGFGQRIKNFASHDFRFGVRYLFADAAPAMYAPGPLVRKY